MESRGGSNASQLSFCCLWRGWDALRAERKSFRRAGPRSQPAVFLKPLKTILESTITKGLADSVGALERKHQVLSCGGDGMPLVKAAFVQAGITTRLFSPTPCRRGGVSPRESCELYPGILQNQAGESTPCPVLATGTARMRSPHGAERAMLLWRPEAASSSASSSFPACFMWCPCCSVSPSPPQEVFFPFVWPRARCPAPQQAAAASRFSSTLIWGCAGK